VTSADASGADVAARARAWRAAAQAAVCDVREPWAHGTVLRASRHRDYYDYNVVRVEDDPGMSVEELVAFADEALAGLPHRRVDFDAADVADRLRPGFEAAGWKAVRLVWMRHAAPVPPLGAPLAAIEEVPYDAAHPLRVSWHREDFPDQDPAAYHLQAREIALRRNVQVLVARHDGAPVGFAHLEREGADAEITQVYVHPQHRGGGRGTALTRAAIEAAGDVRDLWIVADDEDRPKELYARLGFRAAATTMEFLRLPYRRERR
jgi:ribosomal protein S18 acetylase RimI-like enzyme